jgi:hypothetical protein
MTWLAACVINSVPRTMPIAVMPSGQTKYVDHNLDVSVALRDQNLKTQVDRLIRETLCSDPRQLFIRVQGDGGFGPWTFWITWGNGSDRKMTPAVVLSENERNPESVVSRIKAELETFH